MKPSDTDWQAWYDAAGEARVVAGLQQVFGQIEQAIAEFGPTCWASGNCCKFESYGHDLFVTGLEVAWFLREMRGQDTASPKPEGADARVSLPVLGLVGGYSAAGGLPDACPYQVEGLCTAREARPMGCRVFFCQEGTQDWQSALYEAMLSDLRVLHDRHGLPYAYLEWRRGLRWGGEALA